MYFPDVVPEQEWERAHEDLLAKEKAYMREGDRLAAERRRQPMHEITEDHRFEGPDGEVGLLDLFDRRVDWQPRERTRLLLGHRRLQHADVFLHDPRLAVDHERGRQRVDAGEQLLDLRGRHHHRIVHPVIGHETPHEIRRRLVLGDPDDLQAIAVLLLQLLDLRSQALKRDRVVCSATRSAIVVTL